MFIVLLAYTIIPQIMLCLVKIMFTILQFHRKMNQPWSKYIPTSEEVTGAVQLKLLAFDYSQQKHTTWAGRGRIIIAQSKANYLSCTAPVVPPLFLPISCQGCVSNTTQCTCR